MNLPPPTSPNTSHYNSRASYPKFLSLQETVTLQATWAWCGLVDAFRWTTVLRTATSDAEIRANLFKSLLVNALSLTSIYTFDLLLAPLVRDQQKWLHQNVGWFYQILWLFPVLGVSFYLNSSWCTLIAKRTFSLQYGSRAAQQQSTSYTGMLTALATSAYRAVMVFTSVALSLTLKYVPFVGPLMEFAFFCWVDAYYCFEFVWIAKGMSLSRRVRHLEERWAYYFAFGLPSATLCMWGSGLANAALFALVFPAYIMMAMNAKPVPADPYRPASSSQTDAEIRHPSPFVPIRLPVFALVMWLNDRIIWGLSVGSVPINPPRKTPGRGRAFSDAADSMEEGGDAVEMQKVSSSMSQAQTQRNVTGRINIGRRKMD